MAKIGLSSLWSWYWPMMRLSFSSITYFVDGNRVDCDILKCVNVSRGVSFEVAHNGNKKEH